MISELCACITCTSLQGETTSIAVIGLASFTTLGQRASIMSISRIAVAIRVQGEHHEHQAATRQSHGARIVSISWAFRCHEEGPWGEHHEHQLGLDAMGGAMGFSLPQGERHEHQLGHKAGPWGEHHEHQLGLDVTRQRNRASIMSISWAWMP